MKTLFFIFLLNISVVFAQPEERVQEETLFDETTTSHFGVGAIAEVNPSQDQKTFVVTIPFQLNGLYVSKGTHIIVYEGKLNFEFGSAVGAQASLEAGYGVKTPTAFFVYGLGKGRFVGTLRTSGLEPNALVGGLGVEGGAGVALKPVIILVGGHVEGLVSILNPEGDFAEAFAGGHLRFGVQDTLYLQLNINKVMAHTQNDPRRKILEFFLNYKLPRKWRPLTPSLMMLIGFYAKVIEKEEEDQEGQGYLEHSSDMSATRSNEFQGGIQFIFYKE